MKKRAAIFLVTCLMFSLAACSSGRNSKQPPQAQKAAQTQETILPESNETEKGTSAKEEQTEEVPSENSATENSSTKAEQEANNENKETEWNDELEVDFTYDYSEDIKADINYVVSASSSLQEELKNIDKITQKYTLLAESALTQGEMNVASQWFYMIWDTELNNLWERFSDLSDQDTKEKVLEEQRNWIAMKDEVTLMSIGSQEENGSMYPMLVNFLWEENTKNRAYVLANELAKIKGESFIMPEKIGKVRFVCRQYGDRQHLQFSDYPAGSVGRR